MMDCRIGIFRNHAGQTIKIIERVYTVQKRILCFLVLILLLWAGSFTVE